MIRCPRSYVDTYSTVDDKVAISCCWYHASPPLSTRIKECRITHITSMYVVDAQLFDVDSVVDDETNRAGPA